MKLRGGGFLIGNRLSLHNVILSARAPPRAFIIACYEGAKWIFSLNTDYHYTTVSYVQQHSPIQYILYNLFLYKIYCTEFSVQQFPVQHRLYDIFLYNISLYYIICTTFSRTVFPVQYPVQYHLHNISCTIFSL